MLWALIVTATLSPDYKAGGGVDVEMMYGFNSEKACVSAGYRIPTPKSNDNTKGSVSFVCVPMGDVK